MTRSQDNYANSNPDWLSIETLWRPVGEWLLWAFLAILVYAQTGRFDQEIAEYAFGAAGWPRVLCIAVFVGATGQLCSRILQLRRGVSGGDEETESAGKVSLRLPREINGWRLVQRIGIFVFPLLYLFVMPQIGFYVATPLFVLGLLLMLEVRSLVALLTVTAVVYGLVLLIFTRLFFVALPVGRIEAFYDVNNAIISVARFGL